MTYHKILALVEKLIQLKMIDENVRANEMTVFNPTVCKTISSYQSTQFDFYIPIPG